MKKLLQNINEVSKTLNLEKYIIRQWGEKIKEQGINFLTIKKDKHERAYYREEDIEILKRLKYLMYTKKYTMEGSLNEIKNTPKNRTNYDYLNELKTISKNLRSLLIN